MKPIYGKSSASDNARLIVLFDGWPLARAPGSPAAIHLQELLAMLPDCVDPFIAVPSELPEKASAPTLISATSDSARGRFAWEQVILPRLARGCRADLLHTTVFSAALFRSVPVVISPAEVIPQGFSVESERKRGKGWRLRTALGRGGLANNSTILWPADLPVSTHIGQVVQRMPPVVHSAFWMKPTPMQQDEQGYVAAFGPFIDPAGLAALMESWRWAAHAMGEGWALRVAAYPSADSAHLEQMRAALDLPGPVLPAPLSGPLAAAELLAGAGAVLRMGPLCAWGDPLLHALAAARPLAIEDAWGVDARVGPAAYLAPSGDWRALGAAVLTLLVEENIAEQISQAAQLRAAGWGSYEFSARLREVYRAI